MILLHLKKYWSYVALVVVTIVSYFLLKKRDIAIFDQLQDIQKRHQEEIEKLKKIKDDERKAIEDNNKNLQRTLEDIKKKYDKELSQLDDKKKAEVENIVNKHSGNPDELAKELKDLIGIEIYEKND